MRSSILDAAERVIRARGLAKATTREISQAAGCAEGTIYVHFADKLDLFCAVLGERLPDFAAYLDGLPRLAGQGTVAGNLTEVAQAVLAFYRDLIPVGASIFADPALLARHRTRLRRLGTGPQRAFAPITDYLAAEQGLGRVAAGADPLAATALLLGACHHAAFLEQLIGPDALPIPPDRLAGAVVRALLAGLAPPAP